MRRQHTILPIALITGGAGAAIGFALLARNVRRHRTRHIDATVRKALPKRHRRVTRVAMQVFEPLGKWYGQTPIAALATAAVWRAKGPRAAVPIAAASASAASLAWVLEQSHRRAVTRLPSRRSRAAMRSRRARSRGRPRMCLYARASLHPAARYRWRSRFPRRVDW